MPKKFTTELFVEKAIIKHGTLYDYSKVVYENCDTKVIIICKEHGEFKQNPSLHIFGKGCVKCGLNRTISSNTLSQKEFITNCISVHGDKYDYSKAVYKNSNSMITIICKEHGEFEQRAQSHSRGNGCAKCGYLVSATGHVLSQEEFIARCKKIHNDTYDYSKTIYIKNKNSVDIICKIHGEFKQKPANHLQGQGCSKCQYECKKTRQPLSQQKNEKKLENGSSKRKYTKSNSVNNIGHGIKSQDKFISDCVQTHGDTYDYSKTIYVNSISKVIIICKTHGEFEQAANSHLQGRGCSKCAWYKHGKRPTRTQEEFIAKCKEVHGDKYDYSKTIYYRDIEYINIICKIHGEFEQKPNYHLQNHGCIKCARNECSKKLSLSQEVFLNECKQIHGDKYDYSKAIYNNQKEYIIIICKIHGEFEQIARSHLYGQGCAKCGNISQALSKTKSQIDFISECVQIHNGIYDYSKTVYTGGRNNINIICKEHGEFEQQAASHLKGSGCQKCNNGNSKIALQWLNLLENRLQIKIQHAGNIGEYVIQLTQDEQTKYNRKIIKLDGFTEINNKKIAWEFNGCYWHGCDYCYDPDKINVVSNKSMRELNEATINRENILKELGYQVISIRECEFRAINELNYEIAYIKSIREQLHL